MFETVLWHSHHIDTCQLLKSLCHSLGAATFWPLIAVCYNVLQSNSVYSVLSWFNFVHLSRVNFNLMLQISCFRFYQFKESSTRHCWNSILMLVRVSLSAPECWSLDFLHVLVLQHRLNACQNIHLLCKVKVNSCGRILT